MNRFKRPIAWTLCVLLLMGQCGAWAEDGLSDDAPPVQAEWTAEPAQETAAPTQAPKEETTKAPEREATPERTPEATAVATAEQTPAAAQEPTAMPTPEPDAASAQESVAVPLLPPAVKVDVTIDLTSDTESEPEFEPEGEAWARFEDGTIMDGRLKEILSALAEDDQSAVVYLMTLEAISVRGISSRVLNRVKLAADTKRLGEEDAPYSVLIEEVTDEEETVYVIRVLTRQEAEALYDDPQGEPGETPENSSEPDYGIVLPTLAPGDVFVMYTPEPTAEPEPSPDPAIWVEAQNLSEGAWQNTPPTFVLSGIASGDAAKYVYGVFICNERLVLLSNGMNQYVPGEEGELSYRFAILDKMGDVIALSDQFDVLLDMTAPDGPVIELDEEDETKALVYASDALSGMDAISFNGGATWQTYSEQVIYSITGEKGSVLKAGKILVRDRAGNISANAPFMFGEEEEAEPSFGKPGNGGKRIKHVKETMDYSRANYNALELVFPEEPAAELVAGDTVLPLTLTVEIEDEQTEGLFSAKLTTWRVDEEDEREASNALVLTAAQESEINVWSFSGEAYRLLYNSGVEYIVFVSNEYMTAIPTAGFTGGTAYAKLKSGGISTRKFFYTIVQDEMLRETTLSVEVEGEVYLLGEEKDQPMYRYDVLIGTIDMMQEPFASFLPENQTDSIENGGLSDE